MCRKWTIRNWCEGMEKEIKIDRCFCYRLVPRRSWTGKQSSLSQCIGFRSFWKLYCFGRWGVFNFCSRIYGIFGTLSYSRIISTLPLIVERFNVAGRPCKARATQTFYSQIYTESCFNPTVITPIVFTTYTVRTKSRVFQTIEVSESNRRQDRPTIETIQTLLLYAVLELRFNYHISLNLVAHYITVIIHYYSVRCSCVRLTFWLSVSRI